MTDIVISNTGFAAAYESKSGKQAGQYSRNIRNFGGNKDIEGSDNICFR